MASLHPLSTPIVYLKGVGPQRAELLRNELGIRYYQDLLYHFPFRYIDRTRYYKINELTQNGSEVQIVGKIVQLQMVAQKKGKRLVARFADDTGEMELVWFRGHKWLREQLKVQVPYVIFGKVTWYNGFSMAHPEMELQSQHEQSLQTAMQPVYSTTEKLTNHGVTNRAVNKLLQQLFLETRGQFDETLPSWILEEFKLPSKSEALFNIHFPKNQYLLDRSRFRLKLEELFFLQLQLLVKNLLHKKKIKGFLFDRVGLLFHQFYENHLPFELTSAQKRVIKEIRNDMGSKAQMNRLLQGDVGSGKTIVALLSLLIALDNGYQGCLMAPTEILAQQHFTSLSELLKDMPVEIRLLTGSSSRSERQEIHEKLTDGTLGILVGTHAVLEDKVQFRNLGLAIIDEQHRFGVAQRSKLWKKNEIPPHILVMTATPIPRTLAMSVYGDLDISVIDELPPGRKPIRTVHRTDANRLRVFRFLRDEIAKGRQVYIVYPLIEESEKLDYKDLMDGYESIVREFPAPKYQVSIVHGRMKPADKDYEMQRFVRGETQIMVATTVIEVGVNVPNASVMVIESAERFGLSQLHQLRGRVGRGAEQSYCILMSGHKLSADSKVRMQTMTSTNDGFKIAEVDLQLRGPGDLMGTQQSGLPALKIANLSTDGAILQVAREAAYRFLKKDPNGNLPEHLSTWNTYRQLSATKTLWNFIS